jgi:predicted nucleotide-binding protein
LTNKLETLQTLIEVLELEIELTAGSIPQTGPSLVRVVSRRIFLVHGHDHKARAEVARFVEKLGVEVVILDEKPTQGRTVPEQLEAHGDVGFAIVLLTPDDRGGSILSSTEDYQARARQNVMLELGYFWGRLGRSNVCALYVAGVEIPSDFQGVLFTPLDPHDGWRLKLFRELSAAGLNPSSDALK